MPLLAIRRSTRPSLSRSPAASPRALSSFRNPGPATALTLGTARVSRGLPVMSAPLSGGGTMVFAP
jgi:hypothetical protein